MKIALLTIAVFLACIVNGLLLLDAFAIGLPVAVNDVQIPNVQIQAQTTPVANNVVDEVVLFPCYVMNYWDCKPNQPIRNAVRCIHNTREDKKLNRELNREFGREYYYCTKSR